MEALLLAIGVVVLYVLVTKWGGAMQLESSGVPDHAERVVRMLEESGAFEEVSLDGAHVEATAQGVNIGFFVALASGSRPPLVEVAVDLPSALVRRGIQIRPRQWRDEVVTLADLSVGKAGSADAEIATEWLNRDSERLVRLPEVRDPLVLLARCGLLQMVDDSAVRLSLRPYSPESFVLAVSLAVKLARAIVEGCLRPWQDLAQSVGAEGRATATALRAEVDGHEILVNEYREDRGLLAVAWVSRAVIRVSVAGLPEGLRVTRDGEASVRTGDPVLDACVAVRAADAESARRLLVHEEVRTPLLEVIHAHPGSELTDQAVVLTAEFAEVEELEPLVRAALVLAVVLEVPSTVH